MNYRLCTFADRKGGKCGFVIENNGHILDSKIEKFVGSNIKENALHIIYLGLRACKNVVHHGDMLLVDVQNVHLCHWLNGAVEYKDYSDWLDRVFCTLETLDCRYRFYLDKGDSFIKKFVADNGVTKVSVGSIDDMMKEFE